MLKRILLALLVTLWASAALAEKEPAKPDPKVLEEIFRCLGAGLPADWKRAWVVITELGNRGGERGFEAKFFFATSPDDKKGKPLVPCDAEKVATAVYSLNQNLPTFEQRQWKEATLEFWSEGKYDLRYDYAR